MYNTYIKSGGGSSMYKVFMFDTKSIYIYHGNIATKKGNDMRKRYPYGWDDPRTQEGYGGIEDCSAGGDTGCVSPIDTII